MEGGECKSPVEEGIEQRALGMGETVPHGVVHARIATTSHLLGRRGEGGGSGGGDGSSSRGRLGRWKLLLLSCGRVVEVVAKTAGKKGNGWEGTWTLLLQLDEELLCNGRGDSWHHCCHGLQLHLLLLLLVDLEVVGNIIMDARRNMIITGGAWIHATLMVELVVLEGLCHVRGRQLKLLLLLILVMVWGWERRGHPRVAVVHVV